MKANALKNVKRSKVYKQDGKCRPYFHYDTCDAA